jgi:hypothetical protein
MNVIGILQTDLNEFNVLFDQQQNGQNQNNQQGNNNGQGQNQQNNSSNQQGGDDSSGFFGMLLGSNDQDQLKQQNQEPQEMTLRIKGIPEGQKAEFLQMYQIIKDAQEMQDIEQKCTVVSREDQQGQQGQGADQPFPQL